MNAVVYYSNTGQSKAVAAFLAERTGFPLLDITAVRGQDFDSLVLVFPVHCQNIPYIVKSFLRSVKIGSLTAVATYGRMCCGNVLYELRYKYRMNLVAGAYMPAKHTYLDEGGIDGLEALALLVEKILHPAPIEVPRLYKNPLADLFPMLRSQIGVRLYRTADCTGCGLCTACCPHKAMHAGVPDKNCIRCLKCVAVCPQSALTYRVGLILRLYLRKRRMEKILIYT